jgi:malate dehydrogenase
MRAKVAVIGTGNVGGATAQRLAERELADVVCVDIIEGMPKGKALDLSEASPIEKHDFALVGSNDLEPVKGADIAIITAGLPRTPGLSRDDLLEANAKVLKKVSLGIKELAPEAILIIVTNPLDAMCHVAFKYTGFPKQRVIGMAGILDSARFRYFVAQELGVSVESTYALVMGGHGDTMVPMPRFSTVAGVPITELMTQETIEKIVHRTRFGGGEIVNLLKTGGAYYAPGSACAEMAESIIKDKKKILPCSVYLEGEWGIKDLFVGSPIKLGRSGFEGTLEIKLTDEETKALRQSSDSVKKLVDKLGELGF